MRINVPDIVYLRLTLEDTLPYHLKFLKASPAEGKVMRRDWMIKHITVNLQCDERLGARILAQTSTERTKDHQRAYWAASNHFLNHVKRTSGRGKN